MDALVASFALCVDRAGAIVDAVFVVLRGGCSLLTSLAMPGLCHFLDFTVQHTCIHTSKTNIHTSICAQAGLGGTGLVRCGNVSCGTQPGRHDAYCHLGNLTSA